MTRFDLAGATFKCFGAGSQRACTPAETLRRVMPHARAMGITRVAVITGLDHIGIPTVSVVRPNSRCLSVTQGKGCDLDAAKASGLMEAVEHYHAERVIRPLLRASLNELADRHPTVDVHRLPGFVRDFSPHQRILWIEGTALGSDSGWWLPYEMVHLDFSVPLPDSSGFFLMGSSGLASGNTLLEAVCHGIYELIERDAVTLFYARAAEEQWGRRVDPSSVDDPACRRLLERYESAAVSVALWDVTSDVGVACFLCSVLDESPNPFRPIGAASGAGCHLDRGVALSRALNEAAQNRLTRIAGARDDLKAGELEGLQTDEARERSRAQMAQPAFRQRSFSSLPSSSHDTFEADIAFLCQRLEQADLEQVIAVDLSLPSFPVHVVRVVIPGLEGHSEIPGYKPGARARALTPRGRG